MPTTNSRNLTLTRSGNKVTINVKYNAVFSAFERHLAGLGLRFRERIAVIGVDPAGATTGTVLTGAIFPSPFLAVTNGNTQQSIPRSPSIEVDRAVLDEDSNPLVGPDVIPDQIRCRIRLEAIGFPPAVTPDAFTDEEELGGSISTPAVAGAPS